MHRETASRYLRMAKPAKVATGSAADPEAKPAKVDTGSRSLCEPWREWIETALSQGLSATRIHQDLVAEHGFTGRYNVSVQLGQEDAACEIG